MGHYQFWETIKWEHKIGKLVERRDERRSLTSPLDLTTISTNSNNKNREREREYFVRVGLDSRGQWGISFRALGVCAPGGFAQWWGQWEGDTWALGALGVGRIEVGRGFSISATVTVTMTVTVTVTERVTREPGLCCERWEILFFDNLC